MSLRHKVCHALGGLFDLPHAATHAVVLPHVAAFNLPAAPQAEAALARALNAGDPARPQAGPPRALADLGRALGIPPSLAALGLRHTDLDAAANAVIGKPYYNPRPVTRDDLVGILDRAFLGDPPE
jgi:maleylacetate reductase